MAAVGHQRTISFNPERRFHLENTDNLEEARKQITCLIERLNENISIWGEENCPQSMVLIKELGKQLSNDTLAAKELLRSARALAVVAAQAVDLAKNFGDDIPIVRTRIRKKQGSGG